jgi:hypothetical protein
MQIVGGKKLLIGANLSVGCVALGTQPTDKLLFVGLYGNLRAQTYPLTLWVWATDSDGCISG